MLRILYKGLCINPYIQASAMQQKSEGELVRKMHKPGPGQAVILACAILEQYKQNLIIAVNKEGVIHDK